MAASIVQLNPDEVVSEFQAEDGTHVTVRTVREQDLYDCLHFINSLVDEDAPILVDRRSTIQEELVWLNGRLEALAHDDSVVLVAEVSGRVVGVVEVRRHVFREQHVGTVAIGLLKDYRDVGIGTGLMSAAMQRAKDAGFRLLVLESFSSNRRAIHVYEKLGFQKAGEVPGKVSYQDGYVSSVMMFKEL